MSSFKKQAIKLKESLKQKGSDLPLVSVQEALAHSYGFNNRHVALSKKEEFDDFFIRLKQKSPEIKIPAIDYSKYKPTEEEIQQLRDNFQDLERPLIRFVNSVIYRTLLNKASELHIVPKENEVIYHLLIDGEFVQLLVNPKATQNDVVSRFKVMARMDIAEKRLPQHKMIRINSTGRELDEISDQPIDALFYLSTAPTEFGEKITLRVVNLSSSEYQIYEKEMSLKKATREKRIKELNLAKDENEEPQECLQKESNEKEFIAEFGENHLKESRKMLKEYNEIEQDLESVEKFHEDFEITFSHLSSEEAMAQAEAYAEEMDKSGKGKRTSDMIKEIREEILKKESDLTEDDEELFKQKKDKQK